jgi:hypothetical protein
MLNKILRVIYAKRSGILDQVDNDYRNADNRP